MTAPNSHPELISAAPQASSDFFGQSLDQLIVIAANPTTNPSLLHDLSSLPFSSIKQALARNPNTPLQDLKKLWIRYPLAILSNPIVEYRALTESLPLADQIGLTHKFALYCALTEIGQSIQIENILPERERSSWFSPDNSDRESYRQPRHFSPDMAAIRNLPTPWRENLLSHFSKDPSEEVRAAFACTPDLPSHIHSVLANDQSDSVRIILSLTPNRVANESNWQTLADSDVRCATRVAANPSCPQSLLVKFLFHSNPAVRTEAWKRINFSHPTVRFHQQAALDYLLSRNDHAESLREIARRTDLPRLLFKRLPIENEEVSRVLVQRENLTEDQRLAFLHHPDWKTSWSAMDASSSDAILEAAAKHPDRVIRKKLVFKEGPKAAELRVALALDPDITVRLAVIQKITRESPDFEEKKNLPIICAALLRDQSAGVRSAIATNKLLRRIIETQFPGSLAPRAQH